MTHPYLPYGQHTITEADVEAVQAVLKSSAITQGPVVPAFESALALRVGAEHGIAVNSATSALHLACLALQLSPGDRLWTSPITFVASANCALYCGAEVDFVDIEEATGLMSIEALEQQLKIADRHGMLPKVIVPVHLAGSSCNMAEIGRLAEKYGFSVLEDASHAIGGCYREHPVGCCAYSSITVFSFHPVKIITTGEGGMAMTNNPDIARRLGMLRSHGITRDPEDFTSNFTGPWTYEQQELGYNYRMTDIHAALGLSQLQRLDQIVKERNIAYQRYQNLSEDLCFEFLAIPDEVLSSVHLAIARLPELLPRQYREIFQAMRSEGIGVQLHYFPVHLQPYYHDRAHQHRSLPHAEAYPYRSLSVPLYPGLKEEEQLRVVTTLDRIVRSTI
jgi:UDP-4-amino-4,6-dideoxy-N-acetyl-beta-L-altrosamine transaminase